MKNCHEEDRAQLEETKKELHKTQEELQRQVKMNEGLKKELRQERGQKELLQRVKTNLDIRMKHLYEINDDLKEKAEKAKQEKEAIERKLTDRLKDLRQKIHGQEHISKKNEVCKVELEETKQLHKTQEELQRQVKVNEGLKKELRQERGQKELLQTVKTNLDIRMKSLYQVNDELKEKFEKAKQEKEAIERKLPDIRKRKENDVCQVELEKTKQQLHKTQAELKRQVQANNRLDKKATCENLEKVLFEARNNSLEERLEQQLLVISDLKNKLEAEEQEREELTDRLEEGFKVALEKELEQKAALASQISIERATFKTESLKWKEVHDAIVKEKEEFTNGIGSLKNQVEELSTTLESLEEEKSTMIVENEHLTAALNTTEELRQNTGAALEQLIQLYDKKKRKRRFWRR